MAFVSSVDRQLMNEFLPKKSYSRSQTKWRQAIIKVIGIMLWNSHFEYKDKISSWLHLRIVDCILWPFATTIAKKSFPGRDYYRPRPAHKNVSFSLALHIRRACKSECFSEKNKSRQQNLNGILMTLLSVRCCCASVCVLFFHHPIRSSSWLWNRSCIVFKYLIKKCWYRRAVPCLIAELKSEMDICINWIKTAKTSRLRSKSTKRGSGGFVFRFERIFGERKPSFARKTTVPVSINSNE